MFEVEAKVWVKEDERWNELLEKVKKIAVFEKEDLKEDFYFGWPKERKTLFRLRILNGEKCEIVMKNKTIEDGVEKNEEEIFYVDDKQVFLSFAEKLGLEVILKKQKRSLVFRQNEVLIELNEVEGLGNFLEIESVCERQEEMSSAQKKVIQVFQELGFTQKDFEARTYRELYSYA